MVRKTLLELCRSHYEHHSSPERLSFAAIAPVQDLPLRHTASGDVVFLVRRWGFLGLFEGLILILIAILILTPLLIPIANTKI